MPTYVYACHDCEHTFEEFKKITSETSTHNCPKCDKLVKQVVTPVEWRTKGKGWYQNLEKSSDRGEFKHRMYKPE